MRLQLRSAAIAVLCALAAGGGAVLAVLTPAPDRPRPVLQWLATARDLPAFDLAAADRHVTLADLRGGWTLLAFGYASCPDMCPVTLATLAAARASALAANPGLELHTLFVSVDPDRDTPALLADYAAYFGPATVAASGPPEALAELAGAVGVRFSTAPVRADNYTLAHSTMVLLIGPQARLRARIATPVDVRALAIELAGLTQRPG